jgi:NAD(P)-dependent dehydrogenase (short-subunit alcohol dehydrogenase family)
LPPRGYALPRLRRARPYFEGGYWAELEKERPDDFKDTLVAHPLDRMATPYEIADAALFLMSSRKHVTGANLIADGAYTTRAIY